MDAYFPCIETDNYDVLAPLNLPTEGNVLDDGLSKMQNMANMFGLSVQSILRDWPILLAAVTNSPEFIEYRNGDPVIFWGKMLANGALPWNSDIKRLIQNILH